MRIMTAVLGLAAALATAQIGLADTVNLTSSGTWNATGVPSTPFSQNGATWQLSFDLPNPVSSNPTHDVTDFSFLLNGISVPGTVTELQFFPLSGGGMFDLDVSGARLSFEGADIGSSRTLALGTFPAEAAIADGVNAGSGTMTVAAVAQPAAVPEPPTFVLLGSALLFGSGLLYFRQT